jgi:hypothetical protein
MSARDQSGTMTAPVNALHPNILGPSGVSLHSSSKVLVVLCAGLC